MLLAISYAMLCFLLCYGHAMLLMIYICTCYASCYAMAMLIFLCYTSAHSMAMICFICYASYAMLLMLCFLCKPNSKCATTAMLPVAHHVVPSNVNSQTLVCHIMHARILQVVSHQTCKSWQIELKNQSGMKEYWKCCELVNNAC